MILIDEVAPLIRQAGEEKLYLRYDTSNEALHARVIALLRRFPGNIPVVLHNPNTKKTQMVPKDMFVNAAGGLQEILCELLGAENVKRR